MKRLIRAAMNKETKSPPHMELDDLLLSPRKKTKKLSLSSSLCARCGSGLLEVQLSATAPSHARVVAYAWGQADLHEQCDSSTHANACAVDRLLRSSCESAARFSADGQRTILRRTCFESVLLQAIAMAYRSTADMLLQSFWLKHLLQSFVERHRSAQGSVAAQTVAHGVSRSFNMLRSDCWGFCPRDLACAPLDWRLRLGYEKQDCTATQPGVPVHARA
eukprot:2965602-Amphidinium_carterae.1